MEKKSIGSFIAVLRKAKGMTQQDLATMLSVSNKTVSKWECDEVYPDIMLVPVIAEILEVSCDELLTGGRILHEKDEKAEKKIANQTKYLVGKALTKFKITSAISIMLAVVAVISNYIISYSAFRPDIGFGVMISIFAVCITLEIIAILTLGNKFNNNDFFENSGIDLDLINTEKCKYSFILFYLLFAFFFMVLSFILTYILTPEKIINSVLTFGSYIELLPYFMIFPIMAFLPAQSAYKTIFTKSPQINKRTIIFEFVQIGLIACSFFVGFYYLNFVYGNYLSNILPVFLLVAGIMIAELIYVCFSKKLEKNEKVYIRKILIRNLIYLATPIIATILVVYINYLLITATTVLYFISYKKAKQKSEP